MQATDGRLVLSPSDRNDYVECSHLTTLALEAAGGAHKRPHYGVDEPTALKHLTEVYATREDAVDELLRREVFVDLHGVVRQGLRVGMPSYSLKEVEALATFRRRDAVAARLAAGAPAGRCRLISS